MAPEALREPLEAVRRLLHEELAAADSAAMPLLRAALVLAVADGRCPRERLIPLAAGVEMIHHALTAQRAALPHDAPANALAILSHDWTLARALDLYARDGCLRVMRRVSAAAAELSQALLADPAGESELAARYWIEFHASCARIGSALAEESPEREAARAAQVAHWRREEVAQGTPPSNPTSLMLLEESLDMKSNRVLSQETRPESPCNSQQETALPVTKEKDDASSVDAEALFNALEAAWRRAALPGRL